jgi:hypothetical protein
MLSEESRPQRRLTVTSAQQSESMLAGVALIALNVRDVPDVTFSGYGFVPLPPYLERERPPLCGMDRLSLELVFATPEARTGLLEG